MKWNVFSLEAVKTALEPKFVLEKVRYVTETKSTARASLRALSSVM